MRRYKEHRITENGCEKNWGLYAPELQKKLKCTQETIDQ